MIIAFDQTHPENDLETIEPNAHLPLIGGAGDGLAPITRKT